MHERSCFVTLTYSDKHLPKDYSLDVTHFQKFVKRLRKAFPICCEVVNPVTKEPESACGSKGSFRFFHCGEYGDETGRPHYHALLFGVDFHLDRTVASARGAQRLFESPTLDSKWGLGACRIGALSFQSAAYVARYVMKKVTGPRAEEHYTFVNPRTGEVFVQKPEYVTMSRRPGVGAKWFERYRSDVFPSDEVIHDGKKFRPPKYYDGLLGVCDDDLLEAIKQKRLEAVGSRGEDVSFERLEAREAIGKSRDSMYKRKF